MFVLEAGSCWVTGNGVRFHIFNDTYDLLCLFWCLGQLKSPRVSVATACLLKGSPAADVATIPDGARKTLSVEHPTGEMSCVLEVDASGDVLSSALLRTARKLMDGEVFV